RALTVDDARVDRGLRDVGPRRPFSHPRRDVRVVDRAEVAGTEGARRLVEERALGSRGRAFEETGADLQVDRDLLRGGHLLHDPGGPAREPIEHTDDAIRVRAEAIRPEHGLEAVVS